MRNLWRWLGALVLAVAAQAQDFTENLTPAERESAGLHKLAPAELAKLREIVERYKAGEVAVVQQQAEQKVAETQARVAEAEKKVAAAEARARESAGTPAKKGPGWLSALLTLEKAGQGASQDDELHSRLVGPLKSFSGRRKFVLENGQEWQMIEGDTYAGPTYENPAVNVRPGTFGTFWLQIPEAAVRVKVKPLKLELKTP
jgi:hypothetical protein